MIKSILEIIDSSIPENIKADLKKRIVTRSTNFIQFSNELKQMSHNNYDIRSILFKNNDEALHHCGDILAKTLLLFWTKGGELENHFIDVANETSFYAEFECLWT